jgi:hypothetical protein
MHFLDTVLSEWKTTEQCLRETGVTSTLKRATEYAKFVIELETRSHLATIEAWEHGRCLDISVLALASQTTKLLAAGPCDSEDDMRARIKQLAVYLKSNVS